MISQCRFSDLKVCSTLVQDVDSEGAEVTGELSVRATEFCCEFRTAIKINSIKKSIAKSSNGNHPCFSVR